MDLYHSKQTAILPSTHAEQGFSLIEILVALLIFSVGMLGLAHLQQSVLHANVATHLRSLAIDQANSMVERILANPEGARTPANYMIAPGTEVVADLDCARETCDSSQLASYDLAQWLDLLAINLPAGEGEISWADPSFTLTVRWDGDRNGATGRRCPPVDASDLRCVQRELTL